MPAAGLIARLALAALLIPTALALGAWLDAQPIRLHVHPTPAPGTSPTPLEPTP